ncbi:MAG: hypothetical protein V4585_07280 [Bacteroidota bacterium]
MKKLLIVIVSCSLLFCKIDTSAQVKASNINFFIQKQFKRINSELKSKKEYLSEPDKGNDKTLFEFENSVDILEKITDIYAERQQNYLAIKVIDEKTLSKWHLWLTKNKNLLIWDKANNRINRKDKDIYSGLLYPKK